MSRIVYFEFFSESGGLKKCEFTAVEPVETLQKEIDEDIYTYISSHKLNVKTEFRYQQFIYKIGIYLGIRMWDIDIDIHFDILFLSG